MVGILYFGWCELAGLWCCLTGDKIILKDRGRRNLNRDEFICKGTESKTSNCKLLYVVSSMQAKIYSICSNINVTMHVPKFYNRSNNPWLSNINTI